MKNQNESVTGQLSPFDLLPQEDVNEIAIQGGGAVGQALASVARRFRFLSSDEAYYRKISRHEISQDFSTKEDNESFRHYYQRHKYNLLLPIYCAQQSGAKQITSPDDKMLNLPPLHAAAKANADQLFLQLLKQIPDDQKRAALLEDDYLGRNVLNYICYSNNMIMKVAFICDNNHEGYNLLHLTACYGFESFKYLLGSIPVNQILTALAKPSTYR